MHYRDYHSMTARRPLLELMLLGVLVGFLIAGAGALFQIICGVVA